MKYTRIIKVILKSIRPYLQHRRPSSEEEVKAVKENIRVLSKNSFDSVAKAKEAEFGVYRLGEDFVIPAHQIHESMVQAAKSFKQGGARGANFKKPIQSNVFPKEDFIPMKTAPYEIDGRYVKVMGAGVMRYRPIFKEWKVGFDLMILDDSIPLQTVKEILEKAGAEVGIGDYRPKYGLYEVVSFEEQKKK